MKTAFSVSIFLLAMLGCGPEKSGSAGDAQPAMRPLEAKSAADYWPMKEGNSWTYEVVRSVRSGNSGADETRDTITFKVAKVTKTGNVQEAEVSLLDEALKVQATIILVANSKGLYQRGIRSGSQTIYLEPMIPLVLLTRKDDASENWIGSGPIPYVNKIGNFSLKVQHKGSREVDSIQERIACVYVSSTSEIQDGKHLIHYKQDNYFAPGVGLVRSVEVSAVDKDGQPLGVVTKTTTLRSKTLR